MSTRFLFPLMAVLILAISNSLGQSVIDYHLDEAAGQVAYDSGPYHHDGAITGTTVASGVLGNGRHFVLGDYIRVEKDNTFDFPQGNIFVDLWFYAETIRHSALVFKGNALGPFPWEHDWALILEPDGSLRWHLNHDVEVRTAVSSVVSNTWYHVVASVTRDSSGLSTLMILLNGTLVAMGQNSSADLVTNNYPFFIGYAGQGGNPVSQEAPFLGTLDEVKIKVSETASIPVANMAAYYPFNGNANDESGNNNNGAVSGAILTGDRFGNASSAYAFDGVSNYIQTNFDLAIQNGLPFSLVCWFKIDSTKGDGIFLGCGSGSLHIGFGYYTTATKTLWANCRNGSFTDIFGNTTISTDTWHLAAFVVNGRNVQLYLDGVPDGSGSFAMEANPAANARLGSRDDGWAAFRGNLDDVRIYYRTLTGSEIANLYHEGGWAVTPSLKYEYAPDANTIGLWHMNEDAGSMVSDVSPYNNAGISVGATTGAGKFSNARQFSGSNAYINLPETASLLLPGDKLTVEAWVYLNAYPAVGSAYHMVSTGNQNDYDFSVIPGGRLASHLYLSTGPGELYGVNSLPLNKWVHVAMAYDGSYERFYINGVLDTSYARSGVIGGTSQPENIAIGAYLYNSYFTEFFAGSMDEVRISNIARSPGEFNLQLPPKNLVAESHPWKISLQWSNGGGAAGLLRYNIYRGLDSNAVTLVDSTSQEMIVDSNANPSLAYFYRVTSVDSTGFEGAQSYAVKAVALPAAPTLLAPAPDSVNVGIPVAFNWNHATGATKYHLQISLDSSFSNISVDDTTLSTNSRIVSTLSNAVKYYWRVSAANSAGAGPYSGARAFTTVIQAPVIPTLSWPPYAATGLSHQLTLNWLSAANASFYHLQVSADSTFASLIVHDSTVQGTSEPVGPLQSSTTYFWRVKAGNVGGFSAFSGVWKFKTTLPTPSLLSPVNNAGNLSPSQVLTWEAVPEANWYRVQVALDTMLQTLKADTTVSSVTSLTGVSFENGKSYYWRVRASNAEALGPWSPLSKFQTIVRLPSQVLPVSPSDLASVGVDSVRFTWKPGEPSVDRYWFEIASDSLFTFRVVDSSLVDTTKVIRGLTRGQNYWWKVSAENVAGWGSFGPARSFTVLITDVLAQLGMPAQFTLSQNYPNPFNPTTLIRYGLPQRSHVTLTIFNTLGQVIAELVDGEIEPGYHEVRFDASGLSSGVYFYRLQAGSFVDTKKLLLVH